MSPSASSCEYRRKVSSSSARPHGRSRQARAWARKSPKSGRAVSREAGEAYRDRLLALPAFLADGDVTPLDPEDIAAGFRLTGYFLDRHVFGPRGIAMPEARVRLMTAFGGNGKFGGGSAS